MSLAEEMERVARRRHELGEVSVLEPNFAALERTDAQAAVLTARRERTAADRALRQLLALPTEEPLLLLAATAPSWPESLAPSVTDLVARAEQRADLLAARDSRRAADARLDLARADGVPGLSASAGWGREGDDANVVLGGVRFELPFQRNQLGIAEAHRAVGVAAVDADAVALRVVLDVAAALDSWEAAAEQHALATSQALPLAEQNLALVLRAYEAGKEGLLGVLLLQRQALAARRSAIDAEFELHRAAAALERAVGQEVF